MRIDLNCDMGESYGAWHMGCDEEILDFVTSANIACGFHAGDPGIMRRTVALAVAKGVAVGAHPAFPDLQGFGRRNMAVKAQDVYDMVVYQLGALQAFARAAGARIAHFKAHGALYNMAAKDVALADAITQAAYDVDRTIVSYALAGSELVASAQRIGLPYACEVFADRTYQDDGSLTPRTRSDAMIEEVERSVEQVKRMVQEGKVRAVSGKEVPVRADTLCIHGDQPGALAFARRIREELVRIGAELRAPGG